MTGSGTKNAGGPGLPGRPRLFEAVSAMKQELQPATNSQASPKIASRLFRELPPADEDFIALCDAFMATRDPLLFQVVTHWVRMRKTVYRAEYFDLYEKWLREHVTRWGTCDILCYRVLNPMVERFPELHPRILGWARSDQVYVRRASAVCLLQSVRGFRVNVPFDRVRTVCDILKPDPHPHIQKGVGWLLKYAYLTYPDEVGAYLEQNRTELSRTTYRYALEKMDPDTRRKFMQDVKQRSDSLGSYHRCGSCPSVCGTGHDGLADIGDRLSES